MSNIIKFVDLNTGNVFDGSAPYIFWFDGEQSTNIIYSKPICFISDQPTVNIRIEENDIFSLVDTSLLGGEGNVDVSKLYDINSLKTHCIQNKSGVEFNGYYVYIIYLIGSSQFAGEYHSGLTINNKSFLIGADFYDANESLYINLANNGIELPESIQKALYYTNIHEDKIDHIVLNRKFKELISNYWDIVANKGSYKSLENSLKWFEYGDKVKLYEIWKNPGNGLFEMDDLNAVLKDKFLYTLNNFEKTTFIALSYALNQICKKGNTVIYDEEKNPLIESVVLDWSVQDLSLKLCLLGHFYQTYFMPIHLDLVHSTIENTVFTNTFKSINGTIFERNDFFGDVPAITCNVNNGDVFNLGLVDVYVTEDTLFGARVISESNTDNTHIVGVQTTPITQVRNNDELGEYFNQLYSGPGCIVPFSITIPLNQSDMIKKETLVFKFESNRDPNNNFVEEVVNYKILRPDNDNNTVNIKFNLFGQYEGKYRACLQFDSVEGATYIKQIDYVITDVDHVDFKVYKICNLGARADADSYISYDTLGVTAFNATNPIPTGSTTQSSTNKFYKKIQQNSVDQITQNSVDQITQSGIDAKYIQYIPALITNPYADGKWGWNGICLNQLLILDAGTNEPINLDDTIIGKNFFYAWRTTRKGDSKGNNYIICVSKKFGFDAELIDGKYDRYTMFKKEYIYIPEFHYLQPLADCDDVKNLTIDDYTISQNEALCVIPEICYGLTLDNDKFEWEFQNSSTGEVIKLKNSIKEPFIANTSKSFLTPGYYNIVFRYKWGDEIKEVATKSAFRVI